MSVDFARERAWWDTMAATEDRDFGDEAINRALRWRELDRRLDGVETILEIGGGTGAFSIPLARRGYRVTHVDLSAAMLERARANAEAAGVPNITFVEANAVDLSRYRDASFDLVLNMDGAISFCGPAADRALDETCRLARQRVIVAVTNRGQLVAAIAQLSVRVLGRLGAAVRDLLDDGSLVFDRHEENILLGEGKIDYWGVMQSYLPTELGEALHVRGLHVDRCTGLGSLARLIGTEASQKLMECETEREAFLDACERFDHEIMPAGPGTQQRAGIIAVASRHPAS